MPTRHPESPVPSPSLGSRLMWFVGLWVAGVASVFLLALVIKLMIEH